MLCGWVPEEARADPASAFAAFSLAALSALSFAISSFTFCLVGEIHTTYLVQTHNTCSSRTKTMHCSVHTWLAFLPSFLFSSCQQSFLLLATPFCTRTHKHTLYTTAQQSLDLLLPDLSKLFTTFSPYFLLCYFLLYQKLIPKTLYI